MKSRNLMMVVGIVIMLTLGIGGNSFARDGGMHGDKRIKMMTIALDLTDEQQSQIEALQAESRAGIKPLLDSKRALSKQLNDLTMAGAYEESELQRLAEKRGAIEAKLTVERVTLHSKIHAILTPDQQEKAKNLQAEKGMPHGRGSGMSHGSSLK